MFGIFSAKQLFRLVWSSSHLWRKMKLLATLHGKSWFIAIQAMSTTGLPPTSICIVYTVSTVHLLLLPKVSFYSFPSQVRRQWKVLRQIQEPLQGQESLTDKNTKRLTADIQDVSKRWRASNKKKKSEVPVGQQNIHTEKNLNRD